MIKVLFILIRVFGEGSKDNLYYIISYMVMVDNSIDEDSWRIMMGSFIEIINSLNLVYFLWLLISKCRVSEDIAILGCSLHWPLLLDSPESEGDMCDGWGER